jgi:hypothetical protein
MNAKWVRLTVKKKPVYLNFVGGVFNCRVRGRVADRILMAKNTPT